ncbi:hypothetical protein DAI22_09g107800 [Oryza sativa Japonica Group]|nr:hypothetical protein DAI22_09g107800 [Oryza sativa Japonica Group]
MASLLEQLSVLALQSNWRIQSNFPFCLNDMLCAYFIVMSNICSCSISTCQEVYPVRHSNYGSPNFHIQK